MQKIKTYNYLKKYRERTGFSMQDMASVIGMSAPALSKIETGLVQPSIEVIFAYHLVLSVPISKLFAQHLKESIEKNLHNSLELKEYLLDQKATSFTYKRLELVKIIIDRLQNLNETYA